MGWKYYKDTPAVSTADRLPRASDRTVLARSGTSKVWWPTRWSDVTRSTHTEWRALDYTPDYQRQVKASNERGTVRRRARRQTG